MQSFQLPVGTTYIKDSLPLIIASMRTVLSSSSGASFPSGDELIVGQLCLRTDQGAYGKLYEYVGVDSGSAPVGAWSWTST